MGLTTFALAWLAVLCAVLGLAIYRKMVARFEDDHLHTGESDAPRTGRQAAIAGRIDFVDKWGQALTVVVIISGLLLGAVYLYQKWMESGRLIP